MTREQLAWRGRAQGRSEAAGRPAGSAATGRDEAIAGGGRRGDSRREAGPGIESAPPSHRATVASREPPAGRAGSGLPIRHGSAVARFADRAAVRWPAMRRIRKLVGPIRAEQLRSVDWALGRDVGVFIPMAGPCGYAITQGHSHPAWSFIVPFDDLCRVRIDGRVLRSRPDQVCAIGPRVPHEELPGSETARYAAVFVAPGLVRRALRHHGLEQLPPARGQLFAGTPEILGAIREIMLERSARLPGAAPLIDAAAVRLVHHILRALLHAGRRPERIPARASIRRAVALADGSTGDPLTVSDLARAAAMSPSHFSREFKRETGHAPRAYLRRARLERAKWLLAADDRPITDVALECGYCSASHFATAFARAFRLPPSRYRAMLCRGRRLPQRR